MNSFGRPIRLKWDFPRNLCLKEQLFHFLNSCDIFRTGLGREDLHKTIECAFLMQCSEFLRPSPCMNFLRCFSTKLLVSFIWNTSYIGSFIGRSYLPFNYKMTRSEWRSTSCLLACRVGLKNLSLTFCNFNLRICRFKFPLYLVSQWQSCSTQELKLHDLSHFSSLRIGRYSGLVWIWSRRA